MPQTIEHTAKLWENKYPNGSDWIFFCPACKCMHRFAVGEPGYYSSLWKFNGDVNAPTFTPSLKYTAAIARTHSPVKRFQWRISNMEVSGRNVGEYAGMKSPGDFYWHNGADGKPERITFICPCGCGAWLGATVGAFAWKWNGCIDRPTLEPSIRYLGGCQWHGYLTDGVFRSC